MSPANIDGVITVGASIKNGERVWYSNLGGRVDVLAPGGTSVLSLLAADSIFSQDTENIVGDANGNAQYYIKNGTSMAAPIVSGVAALLLQKWPQLTSEQLRIILHNYGANKQEWSNDDSFAVLENIAVMFESTIQPAKLHAFITKPSYLAAAPNNYIHDNGSIEVFGIASGEDFAGYDIATATVEDYLNDTPNFVVRMQGTARAEQENRLAVLDSGLGINGAALFIRLRVFSTNGQYVDAIRALFVDTTLSPGWPRQNSGIGYRADSGFSQQTPITVGDLDGDEINKEIIISAPVKPGYPSLIAINHDGSLVNGFPAGVILNNNEYCMQSSIYPPAITDLENDGELDIVWSTTMLGGPTYLVAVNSHGVLKNGYPIIVDNSQRDLAFAPVIVDIDGDLKRCQ
ncbi:MAG: S8 family serine peptidase [Deltaproteobacteria bacterium]|nr:S8 family serine peptidase [Deltaproteobacteria bacterium]